MLSENNFVKIGFLKKLHGFDGSFILKQKIQKHIDFEEIKGIILLSVDNYLVPFFIDTYSEHPEEPVIHLDTINSKDEAKGFLGSECFIDSDYFSEEELMKSYFLEGYTIKDKTSGKTGKITGFINIPKNPLIKVEFEGKLNELPVNNKLIIKIDHKEKLIISEYPEGLIE